MRSYFDTAVLLKLYVRESNSEDAVALIQEVAPPLPFSHLHRLEMKNAIQLKVGRKEITSAEGRRALSLLQQDLDAGLYRAATYDLAAAFARAEDLATRYAASTLARSLDILHVAIALEIESSHFASLDGRQRAIAKRAGMKIIPK